MSRPKGSPNKVKKEKPIKPPANPVGVLAKFRAHPFLGQSKEVREDLLAKALVKNRGFLSHAAYELQIDNATVTRMIQESDYLAQVIVEIREKLKDQIERKFYDIMVNTKDEKTFLAYFDKFSKNSKMKDRGWNTDPDIQFTQNNLKQVIMNFPEPTNKFVIEGLDFDEKLLNE